MIATPPPVAIGLLAQWRSLSHQQTTASRFCATLSRCLPRLPCCCLSPTDKAWGAGDSKGCCCWASDVVQPGLAGQAIISGTSHKALDTGWPGRILTHSTALDETPSPTGPSQNIAPSGGSIRSTFQPQPSEMKSRFHIRWSMRIRTTPSIMRGPHVLQAPVDEVSLMHGSLCSSAVPSAVFQKEGTDGAFIECPSQPWFDASGIPVAISDLLTASGRRLSSKFVDSWPRGSHFLRVLRLGSPRDQSTWPLLREIGSRVV